MRKLIIALLLVAAFAVSPCSAYIWNDYVSPQSMGYYNGDEILVIDYNSSATNDKYRIYEFDPYADSDSLKLYNCPVQIDDVAYLSDGTIIFILHTGEIKQINTVGIVDYLNQDDGDITTWADIATPDSVVKKHSLVVDGNDNIYVMGAEAVDTLYQLNGNFYSLTSYYADTSNDYLGCGISPDGIYINDMKSGILKLVTAPDTCVTIKNYAVASPYRWWQSIASDVNGNLYIGAISDNDDTAKIYFYNTTSNTATLMYDSLEIEDLVFTEKGDIFATDKAGTITSYQSYDGALGFVPIESADSGSGSSTNPLVDYDGDGEVTQDDAKEFVVSYGPLLWLFMGMIFVTAALGGRR